MKESVDYSFRYNGFKQGMKERKKNFKWKKINEQCCQVTHGGIVSHFLRLCEHQNKTTEMIMLSPILAKGKKVKKDIQKSGREEMSKRSQK